MFSIVNRPTRGTNILDRIYVSDPCYETVKVVTSTVRSDHKAIIAYTGQQRLPLNKRKERRTYRRRSPAQHARFLEYASQLNIELTSDADMQTNFDTVYAIMYDLLDHFYPDREITVTSSDPHFVTPTVKAMLRRKNRLMRAGRTDEASALANRIQKAITRSSSRWLRKIDTKQSPKLAWEKVREVTRGRRRGDNVQVPDGITAPVLNDYFAAISTDNNYQPPDPKLSTGTDGHPSQ